MLESHVLRLQAGRTSSVEIFRQHPFVLDHDVEIAQSAWIHDPIVETAEEGTCILMRAVSLPGGELLTSVVRLAQLEGEIATVELQVGGTIASEREGVWTIAGPNKVQSARVGLQAVAFQSFLPEGKVLLVALQSAAGDAALQQVVLVRKKGGALPGVVNLPFEGTQRRIVLVNGERLRPPSLSLIAEDVASDRPFDHPLLAATSSSSSRSPCATGSRRTSPCGARSGHGRSWSRTRPGTPTPEPAGAARPGPREHERARALCAGARRGPARHGRVRPAAPRGHQRGGHGRPYRTELVDYDVEVAQLAAVTDPVFRALFEGLAVVAGSARGVGQGSLVTLQGSVRLRGAPPPALLLGGSLSGALSLPGLRSLLFDERLQLGDARGNPHACPWPAARSSSSCASAARARSLLSAARGQRRRFFGPWPLAWRRAGT